MRGSAVMNERRYEFEHAPHRHHEILAVGRARAGISRNGPTLPFEGVEEALGAAEFDDIQVVEEFRNDIRRLGRRSLPRIKPRDSFARAEFVISRNALPSFKSMRRSARSAGYSDPPPQGNLVSCCSRRQAARLPSPPLARGAVRTKRMLRSISMPSIAPVRSCRTFSRMGLEGARMSNASSQCKPPVPEVSP